MIQIKVKDLSFSYSGFRALQDISFEAGAGDMLAIIGQNGSGKSTLLKCISRILKINTGHIEIGNISLSALSASKLSRIVAYIPQSTDSISGINVFDTVLLGRKPYITADRLRKIWNWSAGYSPVSNWMKSLCVI